MSHKQVVLALCAGAAGNMGCCMFCFLFCIQCVPDHNKMVTVDEQMQTEILIVVLENMVILCMCRCAGTKTYFSEKLLKSSCQF